MSTFGPAYVEAIDGARIGRQMSDIRNIMVTGAAYTLAELEDRTGYPQSSISAQLRHLRKDRFGGYDVQKRRRTAGTWEYFIVVKVLGQAELPFLKNLIIGG